MTTILESRPSLALAVVFVTWVAIAGLVLIAINLHVRLKQLEQRLHKSSSEPQPYSHLVGRSISEVLGVEGLRPGPRLILFVSDSCRACRRLLDELRGSAWSDRTSLVWTSVKPNEQRVNGVAEVLDDGPRISSRLGIRVTPFGIVADAQGRTVAAAPVNSLRALERHLNGSDVQRLNST